jgi:hypothetical protein
MVPEVVVAGPGTTGILGAEALATTVPEVTRLQRTTRNGCGMLHLISLCYLLIDPRHQASAPPVIDGVGWGVKSSSVAPDPFSSIA